MRREEKKKKKTTRHGAVPYHLVARESGLAIGYHFTPIIIKLPGERGFRSLVGERRTAPMRERE